LAVTREHKQITYNIQQFYSYIVKTPQDGGTDQ
jgi:hypothetical protein